MSVETTIAKLPPRLRAAVDAYQAAIRKRQDWHWAVVAAVEAADAPDPARTEREIEAMRDAILAEAGLMNSPEVQDDLADRPATAKLYAAKYARAARAALAKVREK